MHKLAAQGAGLVVVDNLVNGRRENLDGLPDGQVQLIVADIRDGQRMVNLMRGVDVVFHMAWLGVRHLIHLPE